MALLKVFRAQIKALDMIQTKLQPFWPIIAMTALFLTAVFFRPLLPIDETRYMTVAWEMWLRGDWFGPLTLNFEPYHHKPPLLFWLINDTWSIFGVSRWAGLLPVVFAATGCVYFTQIFAQELFKAEKLEFKTLPFLMTGSVPFLIYSTLVMFDVTLTLFVLLALLALIAFANDRRPVFILGMALAMGLGVLTKGPVAWLYVIFPVLFAPFWLDGHKKWLSWYGGCGLAFILSTIPVLLWLIPVLKASNPDFAFSLIWEQTAGRISGNMENAHTRPVYFYLPLLPVLFLPWAFFPSFWTGLGSVKNSFKTNPALRFLACWIIPVVLGFSFIGGKQPHYLVPLLPGVLIFIAYTMSMKPARIRAVSVAMVALIITGQIAASQTIFKKYDLQPIADYVSQHENKDCAFVRKYQGELTFLGRLHHHMDDRTFENIEEWFHSHPNGIAVIRYHKPTEVNDFNMVMSIPYRGKNIGIFEKP